MTDRAADPSSLLPLAVDAARAAGALLAERFGGPVSGLEAKSTTTDLVSDADRDAEALIVGAVSAARPHDAIVAEEGGARPAADAAVRWHIDPLDGTVNYLWGIPHWAVSIHAQDHAGDLVGVVFDPCRDELFTATPADARLNGRPLRLARSDALGTALLATGFAYDATVRRRQAAVLATLLHRVRDVRRNGSAALDLAWLADGRVDLYYEQGLSIWDSAAGSMIVRAAGGVVRELPPRDDLPSGVLAGRAGIADQLAALLDAAQG